MEMYAYMVAAIGLFYLFKHKDIFLVTGEGFEPST